MKCLLQSYIYVRCHFLWIFYFTIDWLHDECYKNGFQIKYNNLNAIYKVFFKCVCSVKFILLLLGGVSGYYSFSSVAEHALTLNYRLISYILCCRILIFIPSCNRLSFCRSNHARTQLVAPSNVSRHFIQKNLEVRIFDQLNIKYVKTINIGGREAAKTGTVAVVALTSSCKLNW